MDASTLMMIGIALVVILMFTKVLSFVFRIVAAAVIIGILYFGYNSGMMDNWFGSKAVNVNAPASITALNYNPATKEFTCNVGPMAVAGKVGEKKVNILSGGKVIKTIELTEAIEFQNGALKMGKDSLKSIEDALKK